jgi:hypothetical protein
LAGQQREVKEIISAEQIEDPFLTVRGLKVILDRDWAGIYGVKTGSLNQAPNRNVERVPEEFPFVLSRHGILGISQTVLSSSSSALSSKSANNRPRMLRF